MVFAVIWDFTRLWGVHTKKNSSTFPTLPFWSTGCFVNYSACFQKVLSIHCFFLTRYLNSVVIQLKWVDICGTECGFFKESKSCWEAGLSCADFCVSCTWTRFSWIASCLCPFHGPAVRSLNVLGFLIIILTITETHSSWSMGQPLKLACKNANAQFFLVFLHLCKD